MTDVDRERDQEKVAIKHPFHKDETPPGECTREAFREVWSKKGWYIVGTLEDGTPSPGQVMAAAPPPGLDEITLPRGLKRLEDGTIVKTDLPDEVVDVSPPAPVSDTPPAKRGGRSAGD